MSPQRRELTSSTPSSGYPRAWAYDSQWEGQALSSIQELLQGKGQESAYTRFIAPVITTARFAKALGRSVTGSMKELITSATFWLAEGELSPRDVNTRLNEVLLSALAQGKSGYGRPRDAFKALLRQIESEAPEEGDRQ